MSTDIPGLRERKRLATRRAIQLSVLDLVSDRSIDQVTVEEISQRADVSPRTFFNYFPSKEAAAIGDAPQLPRDEMVEAFVSAPRGSDLLDDIATMIARAVDDAADDLELLHRRRLVIKANPQLFAMRMATMRAFEEEFAAVIARRLVTDDPSLREDQATLDERARLLTYVAFGVMRHAWHGWAEADGRGSLSDRLTASFGGLRDVLMPTTSKSAGERESTG